MTYSTSQGSPTGSLSAKTLEKEMISNCQLVAEVVGQAREPVHLHLSIRGGENADANPIHHGLSSAYARPRMLPAQCQRKLYLEKERRGVNGGEKSDLVVERRKTC